MPRFAIVVGEASGDQLARGLIAALRERWPDAEFAGVTGPLMRDAGCESWSDYQPLAIMGLVEVLRHLPGLRRLMRRLEQRLLDERPDMLIGIDAPDFNLRLEAFARRHGIPTVHYVCPSVWAWREGRVKTIRRSCDHVLCLLPFEPGFLAGHGVAGTFVGHPLADEIGQPEPATAARRRLGLDEAETLALLPGSRGAEVDRLGPLYIDTMNWLLERRPALRFMVAAANAKIAGRMQALVAASGHDAICDIRTGAVRDVLAAADAALVASGTATLETMLMQRPMVVAYRINALTAWIVRRLARVDYAALPNLLAGGPLVPEFLQDDAQPSVLGAALLEQLQGGSEREHTLQRFAELGDELRCGASSRAADAIVGMLSENGAVSQG